MTLDMILEFTNVTITHNPLRGADILQKAVATNAETEVISLVLFCVLKGWWLKLTSTFGLQKLYCTMVTLTLIWHSQSVHSQQSWQQDCWLWTDDRRLWYCDTVVVAPADTIVSHCNGSQSSVNWLEHYVHNKIYRLLHQHLLITKNSFNSITSILVSRYSSI